MSLIKISVIDQTLQITDAPLISTGDVNANYVEWDFSSEWDGMHKVAVFYQDKKNVYRQFIDENNRCVIPKEATAESKTMYLGVWGTNADVILTSEVAKYKIVAGAITEDTQPADPTPDIYEQMLQIYKTLTDNYENFYNLLSTNLGEKTSDSTDRNIDNFWKALEYVAKYVDTDLTDLLNRAISNSSTQGVIDLIGNTADNVGTHNSGSVMGKLNNIISTSEELPRTRVEKFYHTTKTALSETTLAEINGKGELGSFYFDWWSGQNKTMVIKIDVDHEVYTFNIVFKAYSEDGATSITITKPFTNGSIIYDDAPYMYHNGLAYRYGATKLSGKNLIVVSHDTKEMTENVNSYTMVHDLGNFKFNEYLKVSVSTTHNTGGYTSTFGGVVMVY